MYKKFFLLIFFFLFIFPFNTFAKNISSVDFGNWDQGVNCNNSNSQIVRSFNNRSWAGWGSGLLYGTASVARSGGTSTSDVPIIKYIKTISSNGQEYQCYFGSFARNNSTQEDLVISFYCPTVMGLNGLEGLVVGFTEQMDCDGTANFRSNGTLTFVQDDNVTVDTSGIISSNNANTQAVRDIGNQISGNVNQVNDSVKSNTQAVNNVNNTINSDDTSASQTQANSFFSGFQNNSHGLTGIISSPLRLIQSISSSTCTELILPLPFVNQSVHLPCMSTIYSRFPLFLNLWRLISTGFICYWVLIRIYSTIKNLQDPNNDRIEVYQL